MRRQAFGGDVVIVGVKPIGPSFNVKLFLFLRSQVLNFLSEQILDDQLPDILQPAVL